MSAEQIPAHIAYSIHRFINIQLEKVQTGWHSVLAGDCSQLSLKASQRGGTRRHRRHPHHVPQSLVLANRRAHFLKKLLHRLSVKGFIVSSGIIESTVGPSVSNPGSSPSLPPSSEEYALIQFRHPPDVLSGRLATQERLVRLVVVGWQIWGAALVYYTGSPDYIDYLERLALQEGLILRLTGLYRRVDTESEFTIYDALGQKYCVPELRGNASADMALDESPQS